MTNFEYYIKPLLEQEEAIIPAEICDIYRNHVFPIGNRKCDEIPCSICVEVTTKWHKEEYDTLDNIQDTARQPLQRGDIILVWNNNSKLRYLRFFIGLSDDNRYQTVPNGFTLLNYREKDVPIGIEEWDNAFLQKATRR